MKVLSSARTMNSVNRRRCRWKKSLRPEDDNMRTLYVLFACSRVRKPLLPIHQEHYNPFNDPWFEAISTHHPHDQHDQTLASGLMREYLDTFIIFEASPLCYAKCINLILVETFVAVISVTKTRRHNKSKATTATITHTYLHN